MLTNRRDAEAQRFTQRRSRVFDDCVGFDLDKHCRIDQTRDFDHACSWTNIAENLTVSFCDFLPIVDVDDVYSRANDVLETGSSSLKRGLDVLQSLNGLQIRITNADNLARFAGGRRARDMHLIADADRPRVSDYWLPLCSA